MAELWNIARGGKKLGPYSLVQMKQMASTGDLLPQEMVLQDGAKKWIPASDFKEFFTSTGTEPASESSGSSSKLWDVVSNLFELAEKIKKFHGTLLSVMAVIPIVGPVIGDFLRPIAPFNFLIFLVALVIAVGLVFLFIRRPNALNVPLGATCVFSVLMAVGFGAWWAAAAVAGGNDKGVLANNISVVGKLQSTVIRGDSVVTEQKIEGDKVAEKVLKEIETEKDAHKLLRLAFEGYPGNVIKAEVTGTPVRKPGKGEDIILVCNLEISVDMEQYDAIANKRLFPVLEKVALRKGEYFQNGEEERQAFTSVFGLSISGKRLSEDHFQSTGKIMKLKGGKAQERILEKAHKLLDKKSEMIITVNSARSGSDDRTTWKWYHVPQEDVFHLEDRRRKPRIEVAIIFCDKGMMEISRDQMTIEGTHIPGLMVMNVSPQPATLSPYLLSSDFYTRSFAVKREIRFVPSELQKMSSIRCSVKNIN